MLRPINEHPAKVYAQIVLTTPQGLGRDVVKILQGHVGRSKRIARHDLVVEIFGSWSVSFDRQVRREIAQLQDDGNLILSDSGAGGYWLAGDAKEAEAYTMEIMSRVKKLAEKARRIERKAQELFAVPPVQGRLL